MSFINLDEFINYIYSNNVEKAKELYEKNKYNLEDGEYFIFREACFKSNLDTIKWLYSLQPINIHIFEDTPFFNACAKGNLDIIKWLLDISIQNKTKINIHGRNEYALKCACYQNNKELGEILYNYDKNFNFREIDSIFLQIGKLKYFDMVNFLCSICPEYIVSHQDNLIIFNVLYPMISKVRNVNNYKQVETNLNCDICMNENKYFVKLNCNHIYCNICIENLENCPVCFKYIDKFNTDIELYKI